MAGGGGGCGFSDRHLPKTRPLHLDLRPSRSKRMILNSVLESWQEHIFIVLAQRAKNYKKKSGCRIVGHPVQPSWPK